ncbi:MAG: hypothetical protein WCH07_03920 [Deltaproteobacteria bacterium]
MTDPSRTNQELIEENCALKQRIKELEQSEAKRKAAHEVIRHEKDFSEFVINSIYCIGRYCSYST